MRRRRGRAGGRLGRLGARLALAAGTTLLLTAQSCQMFSDRFVEDLRLSFRTPPFLRPADPDPVIVPPATAAAPPPIPCPDASRPFQVADGGAVCPPTGPGCPATAATVTFPEADMSMCLPTESAPAASCGGALAVTAEDGRVFCFAPGPVAHVCPADTKVVFGAAGEKVVGCLVACPAGEAWRAGTGCAAVAP